VQTGKGAEAMKNNDNGIKELLKLLKERPELIKELVFEPNNIKILLNSKAARELVIGQKTKDFLDYVASSKDGYPITQCFGGTKYLCAKGTKFGLCGGGTKPF
jgi:hypothetical protein